MIPQSQPPDHAPRYWVGLTGVVHTDDCPRLGLNVMRWAPRIAIRTDRACRVCLTEGLPR